MEKAGSPLGFLSEEVVTTSESNDLTNVLSLGKKKDRKKKPTSSEAWHVFVFFFPVYLNVHVTAPFIA